MYRMCCCIFSSFLGVQYIYLYYMCAEIRYWPCICLFTEIVVCKFVSCLVAAVPQTLGGGGGRVLYIFIHFFASLYMVHCALYLARIMGHRNFTYILFYSIKFYL